MSSSSIEERRAKVIARLEARNAAKNDASEASAGAAGRDSLLNDFIQSYGAHGAAARDIVARHKEGGGDVDLSLAELSAEIDAMAGLMGENEHILPAYDARKALQQLEDARASYVSLQREHRPKKGFAFKARPAGAKKQAAAPTTAADSAQCESMSSLVAELSSAGHADLANVTGGEHVLPITDGGDVTLADLTDCTVRLPACANTLHVARCVRCTVVAAPTRTSVFVEDCVDCTLVVACQQLRAHTSTGCTFAMHVTGAAIMESCTKIAVQPYQLSGSIAEDSNALLARAGLDPTRPNKWSLVQDFNWLAADRPSPNWNTVPQQQWASWPLY